MSGACRVDAELDAERRASPQLLREKPLGKDVDGVSGEALERVGAHGEPILETPDAAPRGGRAPYFAPKSRAKNPGRLPWS